MAREGERRGDFRVRGNTVFNIVDVSATSKDMSSRHLDLGA